MRNLRLIHILFLLLFSPLTWSQAPCSQDILQLYQSSFHSPSVYKKGSCPTNIWNFLKVLENCQIPVSDMQVLYITEDNLNIYLDQGRGGAEKWFFHVVLSWNGFIFDFDYTDQPIVLTRSMYFQKALATQAQSQWQEIRLRVLPAQEYLQKYNPENTAAYGFYYWLLPERSTYPQISVPQFLK